MTCAHEIRYYRLDKDRVIVRRKTSKLRKYILGVTGDRNGIVARVHTHKRAKDNWRVLLERRPSIYSQRRPSPHVSSPWNRILSSEGESPRGESERRGRFLQHERHKKQEHHAADASQPSVTTRYTRAG